MSLMNYGYKKEEIQIRKMTMAELRLGIVQELLKKNYRYVNIRLVNTTCGDVDSYSYLDKAISRGKLDATVRTVLKQDNEDKQWDLYCAITANPLADDVGNFEEFKQRFMGTAPKVEKTEQTEPTMNNAQIKLQVEKANKILNGFVPPSKGGG